MSVYNSFKNNLMHFKKEVDNFKGKDKFEELIKHRLDKTLKWYQDMLENSFMCGQDLQPIQAMKRIK